MTTSDAPGGGETYGALGPDSGAFSTTAADALDVGKDAGFPMTSGSGGRAHAAASYGPSQVPGGDTRAPGFRDPAAIGAPLSAAPVPAAGVSPPAAGADNGLLATTTAVDVWDAGGGAGPPGPATSSSVGRAATAGTYKPAVTPKGDASAPGFHDPATGSAPFAGAPATRGGASHSALGPDNAEVVTTAAAPAEYAGFPGPAASGSVGRVSAGAPYGPAPAPWSDASVSGFHGPLDVGTPTDGAGALAPACAPFPATGPTSDEFGTTTLAVDSEGLVGEAGFPHPSGTTRLPPEQRMPKTMAMSTLMPMASESDFGMTTPGSGLDGHVPMTTPLPEVPQSGIGIPPYDEQAPPAEPMIQPLEHRGVPKPCTKETPTTTGVDAALEEAQALAEQAAEVAQKRAEVKAAEALEAAKVAHDAAEDAQRAGLIAGQFQDQIVAPAAPDSVPLASPVPPEDAPQPESTTTPIPVVTQFQPAPALGPPPCPAPLPTDPCNVAPVADALARSAASMGVVY